jgi:hypothetical protein
MQVDVGFQILGSGHACSLIKKRGHLDDDAAIIHWLRRTAAANLNFIGVHLPSTSNRVANPIFRCFIHKRPFCEAGTDNHALRNLFSRLELPLSVHGSK